MSADERNAVRNARRERLRKEAEQHMARFEAMSEKEREVRSDDDDDEESCGALLANTYTSWLLFNAILKIHFTNQGCAQRRGPA